MDNLSQEATIGGYVASRAPDEGGLFSAHHHVDHDLSSKGGIDTVHDSRRLRVIETMMMIDCPMKDYAFFSVE